MDRWWEERRAELMCIADEDAPVLVYDGETLNDTVFELLSLDGVDGVLFDLGLSRLPGLLQALGRLGCGFLGRSIESVDLARRIGGILQGPCVLLVFGAGPDAANAVLPPDVMPALSLDSPLSMWRRPLKEEVLVVLNEPCLPTDSAAASRLRALKEARAAARGVMLAWGERHGLEAALQVLGAWKDVMGEDAVLVPGAGLGVPLGTPGEALDLQGTGERIGRLKELLPRGTVWLEPGTAALAPATALLTSEGGTLGIVPGLLGHDRDADPRPKERYLNARRICQVPL